MTEDEKLMRDIKRKRYTKPRSRKASGFWDVLRKFYLFENTDAPKSANLRGFRSQTVTYLLHTDRPALASRTSHPAARALFFPKIHAKPFLKIYFAEKADVPFCHYKQVICPFDLCHQR